jgi:hypothetical protein
VIAGPRGEVERQSGARSMRRSLPVDLDELAVDFRATDAIALMVLARAPAPVRPQTVAAARH